MEIEVPRGKHPSNPKSQETTHVINAIRTVSRAIFTFKLLVQVFLILVNHLQLDLDILQYRLLQPLFEHSVKANVNGK